MASGDMVGPVTSDPRSTLKPCRFCGAPLTVVFADLGMCPIANSLVPKDRLAEMEPFYPLRAFVCESCFLVPQLAEELRTESSADFLIGNNVLAHMPDVNDFVAGMKALLKPSGVITVEFPHLVRLVEDNQFDTIYHEHFSYYSFSTVMR